MMNGRKHDERQAGVTLTAMSSAARSLFIVFFAAAGVLGGFLYFIVLGYKQRLIETGAELSLTAIALIHASDYVVNYYYLLAIPALLIGAWCVSSSVRHRELKSI